ncbi:hypothetical protein [Alicyclobacillus sp. SO9]|uniref:hypothetical protein n=1 Tax=Alicyclobacillus sp. SO9 TaxID=2665646 RepID=UPI0018E7DBCF|nr:hypothetical protein [Alicyclobacillus sp. SO9]QQE80933.1 hypothetical protein GI364_11410 [Alicyclobacillus sp. SO9]
MGGWKVEATKVIKLPEDIADDLWIKTPHPKLLPHDVMKALIDMRPRDKDGKEKGPNENPTVEDLDLDKAMALATAIIEDWNLPDRDGKTLEIPSKDPSVWKKVPVMPVITCIFEALNEGLESAAPDPNSSNGSAST